MCLFVCLFRCTPASGQEISSLLTALPPHRAPSSPRSLLTMLPPHRAPSSPCSLLTGKRHGRSKKTGCSPTPHRAPSSHAASAIRASLPWVAMQAWLTYLIPSLISNELQINKLISIFQSTTKRKTQKKINKTQKNNKKNCAADVIR